MPAAAGAQVPASGSQTWHRAHCASSVHLVKHALASESQANVSHSFGSPGSHSVLVPSQVPRPVSTPSEHVVSPHAVSAFEGPHVPLSSPDSLSSASQASQSSSQAALQQTSSAQKPLEQSSASAQALASSHCGQSGPPQSTSVSSPFFVPSAHSLTTTPVT